MLFFFNAPNRWVCTISEELWSKETISRSTERSSFCLQLHPIFFFNFLVFDLEYIWRNLETLIVVEELLNQSIHRQQYGIITINNHVLIDFLTFNTWWQTCKQNTDRKNRTIQQRKKVFVWLLWFCSSVFLVLEREDPFQRGEERSEGKHRRWKWQKRERQESGRGKDEMVHGPMKIFYPRETVMLHLERVWISEETEQRRRGTSVLMLWHDANKQSLSCK